MPTKLALASANKPHKTVAKRGKQYVGALTSAERGGNNTVVCCISAVGNNIPPFIIFPRVHMKSSLMDSAPPGSVECYQIWLD